MFAKKHSAKILQQIVRRTDLPMPISVGPRKRHHKNAVKKEKKEKESILRINRCGFFSVFSETRRKLRYTLSPNNVVSSSLVSSYADFWPNVGKFHNNCVNTVPFLQILCDIGTKMRVVRRKYSLVGTFAHCIVQGSQ